MKLIANDNVLFEQLMSEIYIMSSSITRFNIFTTDEDVLVIEVQFELLYPSGVILKLRFRDINEYSFYYNSKYNFYYVETYKLLKKGDLFYVSFDPDETSSDISATDQDFILFGGFEGYYIDPLAAAKS